MIRINHPYLLTDLVEVLGLKSHSTEFKCPNTPIHFLSIDTRTIRPEPGLLFFAHKGSNHDSHHFLAQLPESLSALILEYPVEIPVHLSQVPVFYAEGGMQFVLNAWAIQHRTIFNGKVIGITGSNGKTIVKEWLFQVLQTQCRVFKSPGSFNSELGVALSLIQLDLNAEIAIFEAGISGPGDMRTLQQLIQPTIGIFTHWGVAHSENFSGDRKALLHEKLELFYGRIPWLAPMSILTSMPSTTELSSPSITTAFTPEASVWGSPGTPFTIHTPECILNLHCEHWTHIDFENALTVVGALHLLGFNPKAFETLLSDLEPLPLRLNTREGKRGRLLLDDTYSMDEESLFLAAQKLLLLAGNRPKVALMSDFPRKEFSLDFYRTLVQRLFILGFDNLIVVGKDWSKLKGERISNMIFFDSLSTALQSIDSVLPEKAAVLIKGGREAHLEQLVNQLILASHRSQLTISVSAVLRNLAHYKAKLPKGVQLMVMVKASNYGIGYRELPILLQNYGVDCFGVAFADEGIALRELGVRIPIMVLNAQPAEFELLLKHQLEPELYSVNMLKAWMEFVETNANLELPGCHLKVNTGMNRLGLDLPEIQGCLKQFPEIPPGFKLISVFSHLMAAGNSEKDSVTRGQVELFQQACKQVASWIKKPFKRHISNSEGQARFPEFSFDLVRLGIGLYGPQYSGQPLEEALRLTSYILQVRQVKAGEFIGYGADYTMPQDGKIAVIAIGYADGLKRVLSRGKGHVLVQGIACPILGNVCMDVCMVDVSQLPDNGPKEGDEVVIFGFELPLCRHAEMADTISYEILTSIAPRLPRVFEYD